MFTFSQTGMINAPIGLVFAAVSDFSKIPLHKLEIEAQHGMGLLPTQTFIFHADGNKTRIELSVKMRVSGFFKLMQFMLPGKLKKIWTKYFLNLDQLLSGR